MSERQLSDIGIEIHDGLAGIHQLLYEIRTALDVSNIMKLEAFFDKEDPLRWMSGTRTVMETYANMRGNSKKFYKECEQEYWDNVKSVEETE